MIIISAVKISESCTCWKSKGSKGEVWIARTAGTRRRHKERFEVIKGYTDFLTAEARILGSSIYII